MALLGELAVNLIARTTKFEKGMDRARKKTKGFQRAVQAVNPLLGKLGVALSGVGFVAYARSVALSTDALAKQADKLELPIERLQAYQLGAVKAGVGVETLNTALQRMVRRVSEAAQGTGEAKNAIAELGLEATTLAQMNASDQYEAIAEAMRGIGSQGDRVRLAMRIFDTEGVGLVNAFAAGVKESRLEFEKFDTAIDRDTARKIEELNDKIAEIGFRLKTATAKILGENIKGAEVLLEAAGFGERTAKQKARLRAIELDQRPQQGFFGKAGAFDFASNPDPVKALGGFMAALVSSDATRLPGARTEQVAREQAAISAAQLQELRQIRQQQNDRPGAQKF